jgi:hypothetical protein
MPVATRPLRFDVMDRTTGSVSPLRVAVVVGALGVVFGDIGTSPIYTIQTVFNPEDPHPVPVSTENVYGVVSLIFWSVMLIVTITYVSLAMRIDNDGEGGIMALITLLRRWTAPSSSAHTWTCRQRADDRMPRSYHHSTAGFGRWDGAGRWPRPPRRASHAQAGL